MLDQGRDGSGATAKNRGFRGLERGRPAGESLQICERLPTGNPINTATDLLSVVKNP
jgi:hypothetical protein